MSRREEPTFLGLGYEVQNALGFIALAFVFGYTVWALFPQPWP